MFRTSTPSVMSVRRDIEQRCPEHGQHGLPSPIFRKKGTDHGRRRRARGAERAVKSGVGPSVFRNSGDQDEQWNERAVSWRPG